MSRYPRQVDRLLRSLAALPVVLDDLDPADYAILEACCADARDEVARMDRADRARAAADAERTARVKKASKARTWTADPPELREAKEVVRARSGGFCEAKTPVCDVRAQHVHHRALRKAKGCHAPDLLLHVCQCCHDWIHANPEESYEAGWLVRSGALPPVTDNRRSAP